ncbi:MAG: response regulator [Elusimicrobiota bacterium]
MGNLLEKNKLSSSGNENSKKRILIVEDNPAELRMLHRSLSLEENFSVKSTNSGYQAGFLTQSFKPDLIILDIFLEDVDGREVAKTIQADNKFKRTKIAAITGTTDPKEIETLESCCFDEIIYKPIAPHLLRQKVKKMLE